MTGEFRRRPKLQKGALVAYDQPILGPVPNTIVLQYNPEQLTRTLQPRLTRPQPRGAAEARNDVVLVGGPPSESISLAIELDAADQLAVGNATAVTSGIHPALAALELLMYPRSRDVRLNEEEAARGKANVRREDMPLVLFVWGEARVLPVRVSSFSVTEQAFDPKLNPIRARADLGLQVLTYVDLPKTGPGRDAYRAMMRRREELAMTHIRNTAESILALRRENKTFSNLFE
jgi:hypothetical protein